MNVLALPGFSYRASRSYRYRPRTFSRRHFQAHHLRGLGSRQLLCLPEPQKLKKSNCCLFPPPSSWFGLSLSWLADLMWVAYQSNQLCKCVLLWFQSSLRKIFDVDTGNFRYLQVHFEGWIFYRFPNASATLYVARNSRNQKTLSFSSFGKGFRK